MDSVKLDGLAMFRPGICSEEKKKHGSKNYLRRHIWLKFLCEKLIQKGLFFLLLLLVRT